ncbi:type I-E CRISPR-associated protein Cse2/CasB [Mixta theicola]|uniref:Type I-E CRISPR-associated protein Cse2/CasB n=1 Tax=Mixta theicola TaxID=1458355 RepID=A0A2K1Q995_9GAMM|nr:type I-E CRISPR-associated protein Cse2/CasB [Mixta theicola]PNS11602.1 type I-E CRISPR-associated protein Cse2/CasB [Mixta theicola]GLR08694.1 type I-E CRISPR-associated protein Cse2/CasB [Mixta theicola]
MLNNDTAAMRKITHPEAQKALLDWFAILSERYAISDKKQVNGRAWRAELKRMELPYGVMMCEGYNNLRQRLNEHMPLRPVDEMALALFVSVAAHIKSDERALSFAAQLGEQITGAKSVLSSLRFERLQKANDPENFCQLLIRAVKIRAEYGVNVLSLADSIFLWMEEWLRREEHLPENSNPFARNRIRWASEYLSTARAK